MGRLDRYTIQVHSFRRKVCIMSDDEKAGPNTARNRGGTVLRTGPRETAQAERRIGTCSGRTNEETACAKYSTSGTIFHRFGVAAISLAGIDRRANYVPSRRGCHDNCRELAIVQLTVSQCDIGFLANYRSEVG